MPTSGWLAGQDAKYPAATLSAPCSGRRAARILPPPSVHAVTSGVSTSIT